MAGLGRRLGAAFSYGTALGFVFYCLGEFTKQLVGISAVTGPIGFAIGFACSIGLALAEDVKEHLKKAKTE